MVTQMGLEMVAVSSEVMVRSETEMVLVVYGWITVVLEILTTTEVMVIVEVVVVLLVLTAEEVV